MMNSILITDLLWFKLSSNSYIYIYIYEDNDDGESKQKPDLNFQNGSLQHFISQILKHQ